VIDGKPCVGVDGTVELRPVRAWSGGIGED